MNNIQATLRTKLIELSDESYFKFSTKLNPQIKLIGVRMPKLRTLAKKYEKDPQTANLLITPYAQDDDPYLEELMIQAILIAKLKLNNRFEIIEAFIPNLKGWALCDLLCAELNEAHTLKDEYWNFVYPKFLRNDNQSKRFAAVMTLHYFTKRQYLDKILDTIKNQEFKDYYVSMGIAWMLSVLFIEHPERVYNFIKSRDLYLPTLMQTLQKILDSYKVENEQKTLIRALRNEIKQGSKNNS